MPGLKVKEKEKEEGTDEAAGRKTRRRPLWRLMLRYEVALDALDVEHVLLIALHSLHSALEYCVRPQPLPTCS